MAAITTSQQPAPVSPLRISAWSFALAIHGVAFGLLLLPAQALLPALPILAPKPLIVNVLPREVVPPPPPAPPIPRPPQRNPTPRPTPMPDTVPVQIAPTPMSIPAQPVATTPTTDTFSDYTAPVTRAAQIAYEHAPPPPYPRNALKRSMEGTVLLVVHVDASGRPREVRIEKSSGHALLDRTASEHVLARWRFQPALQDGVAVDAWARVPVSFRMQSG
jgi:periplasmic protein TonB